MTPMVDPWGLNIDWSKLTDEQVARHLNDSRFQVRERAINECVNRSKSIVPILVRTLTNRDTRERLGAVWALTRMRGENREPVESVKTAILWALQNGDASVRLAAVRSLATYSDPKSISRLVRILRFGFNEPHIRREAATALGRLGDANAIPELLQSLPHAKDRSEEHALIYALIELGQVDAILLGLQDTSPSVKRGTIIAVEQIDPAKLLLNDMNLVLDAEDKPLRQAVLKIYQRHATESEWAKSAAGQLREWLATPSLTKMRGESIQGLLLAFAGQASVAQVIGETLSHPDTSPEIKESILASIAGGNKLPLHESWVIPLNHGLDSENDELVQKTIEAVSALDTNRFQGSLQQIGIDASRNVLLRVLAIEAASGPDNRLNETAFALLTDLIGKGGESKELARAVQLIAGANLTKDQLLALAEVIKSAGPVEIRSLIPPYQRAGDKAVATAFLSAMEQSRSLMSVPPVELSDIIKSYPEELRGRANALLDRLKQEEQQRLTRLDQLLPRLKSGDAERGRVLFFAEKSKCATCHRVNDQGGKIGPDLTTIGLNRSPADLLESIVFPSATLVRDYQPYTLLTTEGQTLTGLVIRDTGDEILVQQQIGEPVRVLRKDIETMLPSTVSIMPNGLEKSLTEAELADVVAYLQGLKARKED
jgi:putative heme-binding domain-containing protein